MSPTAASMLPLLLLLLLLLLLGSNGQSVTITDQIDFASGSLDARVQMPAGTVHVRAYAAAQNDKILQKIQQGYNTVYKLSQLKWYTPGYLTVQPFVSAAADAADAAGNVRKFVKVRDFFELHYHGDSPYLEMRMSLLSDEIVESLAAEASYSFSQTDSIATRQILLMDLKQIICDSASLNLKFVSVNTQHQPYQLISVNSNWTASAFRSFVQNKLIRANSVLLNCNLKFASMDTNVTRQLRTGDVRSEVIVKDKVSTELQMMDHKISNISSDLMEQVDDRLQKLKSELQKLTNEYRRLDKYLGYKLNNTEDNFDQIKVDNRTFIVFQQIRSGSVSFIRKWRDYEMGFGDKHNFWLGLSNIALLTFDNPRVLRVELERFDGAKHVLEYEGFRVLGPSTKYRMSYTRMIPRSNNYPDPLEYHKHQVFTTFDFDNDNKEPENCANHFKGGWWYNKCYRANPNGIFYDSEVGNLDGIQWKYVDNSSDEDSDLRSFKSVRMLLEV